MTPDDMLKYPTVIDEICKLRWQSLTPREMTSVAWAYYYFSIQFRENLEIARDLYPDDVKLQRLEEEECNTANLSPWPGIAEQDEKMNHDEYMRRTLELVPIEKAMALYFTSVGQSYLSAIQKLGHAAKAASIASYEDGGLEKVFSAILKFSEWNGALLQSFEHFLAEHVRFDSDPDQGHGALSRHIVVDDSVLPLWEGFRDLLITCVPGLAREAEAIMLKGYERDEGYRQGIPLCAERLDTSSSIHEAVGQQSAHDDFVGHP